VDIDLLWDVVQDTTAEFRKGATVTTDNRVEGLEVKHLYAMPHADQIPPHLDAVDVHFEIVGVDKERATARRDELLSVLREWPDGRLAQGPSYIEAGGVLGDQGIALRLYALGQVLELWDVITPERMGMSGEAAEQAAGAGYVMVTGFRDPVADVRVVTVEIAVRSDDETSAENTVLEVLTPFIGPDFPLHEAQVVSIRRSFSETAKAFGAKLW
jgi:hypothetical protein